MWSSYNAEQRQHRSRIFSPTTVFLFTDGSIKNMFIPSQSLSAALLQRAGTELCRANISKPLIAAVVLETPSSRSYSQSRQQQGSRRKPAPAQSTLPSSSPSTLLALLIVCKIHLNSLAQEACRDRQCKLWITREEDYPSHTGEG